MRNFITLIRQCLLAVSLAGMAFGAAASPVNFHVTVDPTTLTGPGLLTFGFSQLGGAGPVLATVTNLTGVPGALTPTGGVAIGPNGFTIANGPELDNFADVDADFTSKIDFDLAFDTGFMNDLGAATSTLALFLLDTNYGPLAGDANGMIASFVVVPGAGISVDAGFPLFATVQGVPEPSALLLMLTGFGMVGFMLRHRAS